MANPDFIFIDGFDHYTDAGDNTLNIGSLITRDWTTADQGNGMFITAALSGPAAGCALRVTNSGNGGTPAGIRRTVPGNYARHIGGVTFKPVAFGIAGESWGVCFIDGTTFQLSIVINSVSGTIAVKRGDGASGTTTIATSAESVTSGSVNVLEWDVTIHNTTGIVKVWLNGVLTTLNLTGQNTRGGTTNNYYNNVALLMFTNGTPVTYEFDHFYSYSYTASGGSETPLLNSPIIETEFAISDSSVQFTVGPAVLGKDYRTTTATNAAGANQLVLRKFTAEVGATLNSVSIVPGATSGTAKFKAVLYADSSGSPGALTATGTEVVGCTSGNTLTLPFSAGQTLTGVTDYWVGYITDTSVVIQRFDSTTTLGQSKANTYASGAPNPAGAMTINQPTWQIWGNLTAPAANWAQVNKREPSLAEYDSDSTVGHKDLYNFPALSVTPSSIALVAVRAAALKSDGGARTINLITKSGATTGNGNTAGISPGLALAYVTSYFLTDPNTSAAWTATNVNNATSGVEIAS